jgi:hypothetical protein
MGLFDVRCGVTRISTLWRPDGPGRRTHSMFLVEQLDGAWVPWTPPIRGTYDRYGGIELWPEDISDYTEWAGEGLWLLWQLGNLETDWPRDLERHHNPDRGKLEIILHHGAETAYNGVTLTIDGRPCRACIVHDSVADAIAAADRSPPRTLADALAAWFPAGGAGRRYFADPPASALPQLTRYASVWSYARARRGLSPIGDDDGRQHDDADIRRFVREARAHDDGPLRRLFAPADPAEDAAERAYVAALARDGRPYSPRERFAPGDVLDHPKFGRGLVEAVLDNDKLRVRFADEPRVLVHARG